MIAVERNGIELDYCISCSGLWFDHGELDLLGELTGADFSSLDAGSARQPAGSRACPRCRASLHHLPVGTLQLDSCPRGDGLWFDHGELGRFVDQGLPANRPLGTLRSFLGEVFGDTV